MSNQVTCGYYGWTGTSVIYKHMLDMFSNPNSTLTTKTASPQTITDYIQYVLVPEASLLLIAQDQHWDLDIKSQKEDAIFLMEESEEWGALVHSEILEEKILGEAFS
jgi:RTC4-like domain